MAIMEEKFIDINDLYRRITPALNAKVAELKRANDILNVDELTLIQFLKNNN